MLVVILKIFRPQASSNTLDVIPAEIGKLSRLKSLGVRNPRSR